MHWMGVTLDWQDKIQDWQTQRQVNFKIFKIKHTEKKRTE